MTISIGIQKNFLAPPNHYEEKQQKESTSAAAILDGEFYCYIDPEVDVYIRLRKLYKLLNRQNDLITGISLDVFVNSELVDTGLNIMAFIKSYRKCQNFSIIGGCFESLSTTAVDDISESSDNSSSITYLKFDFCTFYQGYSSLDIKTLPSTR